MPAVSAIASAPQKVTRTVAFATFAPPARAPIAPSRARKPSDAIETPALVAGVSIASLGFLALLGAIGARAGGANLAKATVRVTFWGALAMALTAGIGAVFGTVV